MNYNVLEMMGLGNIDLSILFIVLFALVLILFIIVIVLITKMKKLTKRYEKFMTGKNAKSLEREIGILFDDQEFIKKTLEENKRDITDLYKRMEKTFQKIGLVKYDAFNQMGGQLSFCIALLDENNNGFIMNSVHSAEGCYSYTKEIENGKCNIQLGEEEEKALAIAMK